MRGRFITFEGVEGSGKSTQIERLARVLQAEGADVLVTREPGGTALGARLRELILGAGPEPVPLAELFLVLADRAQHTAQVIEPALRAGRLVLCDRFTDATMAYQGGGRGIDPELLGVATAAAASGLSPEVTIVLDLPVEDGIARVRGRGDADRLDREAQAFHRRVREVYRARAAAEPQRLRMMDAAQDPERVHRAILEAVRHLLA